MAEADEPASAPICEREIGEREIGERGNSALAKFPTKEAWIARFRPGRVLPDSAMHWGPFSTMTDVDLEALYVYLTSLPPIDNDVGLTVVRDSRPPS